MPGLKWTQLARTAKRLVDDRGGVEALKADAAELQKIAKSEGSIGRKAGTAVATLKRRATATNDEPGPTATQPAGATDPPAGATP